MHHSKRLRAARRVLAGTLAALAFCACAQAQTRSFEIPSGDLRSALEAYAAQSGVQLVYKIEDVRGLSTKGVKRSASSEDALQNLLEGTPLKVRRDAAGAVVLFVSAVGASAADGVQQLDSVMVSASRRREPVREVPMQVNVLSTEALQRSGAKSLGDYLTSEAGVELTSVGGPGYGSVGIRGVTTGSQTIATVGAYVDDVAVGSSSAFAKGPGLLLDMGLLDLNHIELLRGPQGTLYGASAMGGVLKYVTNVPDTGEFSGKVSLGGTTTKNGRASTTVSGVVNVPLKEDVAAVRVSAYQDRAGGWVEATGPAAGSASNRGDSTGARASVLVTPTKDLTFRLTATVQDIKRDGYDFVDYNPATSLPVAGELSRSLSLREPYRVKTELYSAEVEYELGWARLNSVTSMQKVRHEATIDATAIYNPLLGGGFSQIALAQPASFDRTSQEFRLTSKSDAQLEWLAGIYITRETGANNQTVDTVLTGGAAGPQLAAVNIPSVYKEFAAFGDLTWKFNSAFAVTAGVRVAHNHQTFSQTSSGPLTGNNSLSAESSEDTTTYLLTGRYALNSESSIYGRVATGYRPGGPNAVVLDIKTGQPVIPNTTFASDSLTSYEVGYKADLLNKVLSVEAAIYDLEWRNIQQPRAISGVSVIANAGNARVQGAELSATYRPLTQWTLIAKGAYTDAKFTEDAPGLGATTGDRLPDSPKFSASLSANYSFALAANPAYAGVAYRYVGSRDAGIRVGSSTLPSYKMPSYSLVDLQAGIDVGRFGIGMFVRNVFDKRAQLSAGTAFIPLGGNALVSVAQPRTFGLTVSASF